MNDKSAELFNTVCMIVIAYVSVFGGLWLIRTTIKTIVKMIYGADYYDKKNNNSKSQDKVKGETQTISAEIVNDDSSFGFQKSDLSESNIQKLIQLISINSDLVADILINQKIDADMYQLLYAYPYYFYYAMREYAIRKHATYTNALDTYIIDNIVSFAAKEIHEIIENGGGKSIKYHCGQIEKEGNKITILFHQCSHITDYDKFVDAYIKAFSSDYLSQANRNQLDYIETLTRLRITVHADAIDSALAKVTHTN